MQWVRLLSQQGRETCQGKKVCLFIGLVVLLPLLILYMEQRLLKYFLLALFCADCQLLNVFLSVSLFSETGCCALALWVWNPLNVSFPKRFAEKWKSIKYTKVETLSFIIFFLIIFLSRNTYNIYPSVNFPVTNVKEIHLFVALVCRLGGSRIFSFGSLESGATVIPHGGSVELRLISEFSHREMHVAHNDTCWATLKEKKKGAVTSFRGDSIRLVSINICHLLSLLLGCTEPWGCLP